MLNHNKLWTKEYIFLLIESFFLYIGFMVFMPTLPARIIELGGSQVSASLSVGLFSIVALFTRAISGSWNDRIGSKILILVGLLILIISTFSFYFSSIVFVLLVIRLLQGAGWGISTTSIATGVSTLVPPAKMGEGIGFYGLTTALGMSIAPILAILIINMFNFHFLITFALVFLCANLILLSQIKLKKKKPLHHTTPALLEKSAVLPAFLCLLMAIPLGGIQTFMMVYGNEIHVSHTWIYFLGQALTILISRFFAGRLYDVKGHRFVIIPGILSMALGLIVLSMAWNAPSLFVAALIFGLGYGMTQPALQALAVERAAPDKIGAANGTFLSGMDLGMAIGSFGLSLIATYSNYSFMYLSSITALIVLALTYWFTIGKSRVVH
ncbi:MFS transporter [Listeria fleischmannii]|uniref:MFS transporter n=1 Tax=Listeria fleischmannii TaxID=1069827 RepID=UPI000587D399|nr:MFS transporter [Listeria fleischmannii]